MDAITLRMLAICNRYKDYNQHTAIYKRGLLTRQACNPHATLNQSVRWGTYHQLYALCDIKLGFTSSTAILIILIIYNALVIAALFRVRLYSVSCVCVCVIEREPPWKNKYDVSAGKYCAFVYSTCTFCV